MSLEAFAGLQARLDRDPRDLETWAELGALARRAEHLPAFLDVDAHAPLLLELLREAPSRRNLARLLVRLLGWQLEEKGEAPPGPAWKAHGRLGEASDHWFDSRTGLPLGVRLPGYTIGLRWIPLEESGVFLGTTPVDCRQYGRVLGQVPKGSRGPDHPVHTATFGRTQEFLAALKEQLRERGALPESWRVRLPEEDEWEHACTGGGTVEDFGEIWCEESVPSSHAYIQVPQLQPVGQFPATGWGLQDMLGTVPEWCGDPLRIEEAITPHSGFQRGGGVGTPRSLCTPDRRVRSDLSRPGGFRVLIEPRGRKDDG